jgi:hypothetical protein
MWSRMASARVAEQVMSFVDRTWLVRMVDGAGASYQILWNALKRLAAGYSPAEKAALFRGIATCVYRLT